jgi:hypothetical protein
MRVGARRYPAFLAFRSFATATALLLAERHSGGEGLQAIGARSLGSAFSCLSVVCFFSFFSISLALVFSSAELKN